MILQIFPLRIVLASGEDRRSLDVDIHPNFRTLMEHEAFLSIWCGLLNFTSVVNHDTSMHAVQYLHSCFRTDSARCTILTQLLSQS